MRQAALRGSELVGQILAFSRQTESGRTLFKLSKVLREVLKLIRASIPASIEIPQDIRSHKHILADPVEIHQVIMNLCTNTAPGPYALIRVADTGPGMDEEQVQRIF